MAELPKFVRARLTARQTSGVTEHPDADLLTAFAEQALSSGERDRVAGHLAQCAVCREVVSTALPEVAAAEGSATAPARPSRWLRTPVLRWVAVGAGVVVVGAAVLLHKPEQPQSTPEADREKKTEVAPGEARRVGEPPANALAKAPAASDEAANQTQLAKTAPSATKGTSKQVPPSSMTPPTSKLQAYATTRGAAEDSKARRDLDQLYLQKDKIGKSKEAGIRQQAPGGLNMRQNALPPPQPIPAAPPPSLYADEEVTKQNRTVDKNAAVNAAPAARNEISAGTVAAARDQAQRKAAVAKAMPTPPPPPAAPTSSAAEAQAFSGGIAQGRSQAAAAERTRWTNTPEGKLQRSVNGGASWEPVVIDDKVEFHAVTSIGTDVWAGGSGGALYHSTDGGGHWTRITLATAGDIVRIEFTGSANGLVKTSSGETWTTQDSGATWKRR